MNDKVDSIQLSPTSTEKAGKRKRGRPGKAHQTKALHAEMTIQTGEIPGNEDLALSDYATIGSQKEKGEPTLFSATLHAILQKDRTELRRVAKELNVTENTIYRWMNGSSDHPRPLHLHRLPEVMSEYSQQLTIAINQTFGPILDNPQTTTREITRELYVQVLEIFAADADSETRFWHIIQTISEQAVKALDSEHQGVAITYAQLSPPHEDGIHSLREIVTYGSAPWERKTESKVYLGSTSLAGTAATLQRLQIWNSCNNQQRVPVEIDTFEQSACAAPICRGHTIAGVLIVSSTQPHFFQQESICATVEKLAKLLNIVLNGSDFYDPSCLNLRPMPALAWQRQQLASRYNGQIIAYAGKHFISRKKAELFVEKELELLFERHAQEAIYLS